MKRFPVPTVVLVAAAALVALLVYGVVEQQRGAGDDRLDRAVQRGERPPAPALELARPAIDGGTERQLADYRGQVVVLNFWASWCVPCEKEAPVLNAAQDELARAGDGTVVGVTYQDAADASRGFARKNAFAFPTLRDPDEALFEAYGNRGVPETIVLDARGRIADLRRGPVDREFLEAAVAKARAAA